MQTDLAAAKDDADRERKAAEAARTELAKALLRLEAMPRLEVDLAALRAELDKERQGRVTAEQQAAVLTAKLEAATDRAGKAEAAAIDATKEAKQARSSAAGRCVVVACRPQAGALPARLPRSSAAASLACFASLVASAAAASALPARSVAASSFAVRTAACCSAATRPCLSLSRSARNAARSTSRPAGLRVGAMPGQFGARGSPPLCVPAGVILGGGEVGL